VAVKCITLCARTDQR